MKCYLKDPRAFAGGWFHSGGLAVVDPDGYIKLKDRQKDIIISGGENISPLEVEDALLPGNVGLFCSTPAVAVARHIGWKRVMEMLLTREPVDPRTAHAWGLINRVVPAEALHAEVRRFADLIVAHSAATIALGKRTFYRQIGDSFEAA